MTGLRAYWRDVRAASAAEFALVLVPFLAAVFGIIGVSLMLYANHCLEYAAEGAARCYAVNAVTCPTAGATQTYANSIYTGPNITPVFTAQPYPTGCGHTVTASATIPLNAVVISLSVPLSATACFP